MELNKCEVCHHGYFDYCKNCAGELDIYVPPPKIEWGIENLCHVCGKVVMRDQPRPNAICFDCRQIQKKIYYLKNRPKFLAIQRQRWRVDKRLAQSKGVV